jgi:hypothetical protein
LPDVTSLSGIKLRLAHVGKGPVADFLVGAEDRALLLKSEGGKLVYRKVPLPGLVRPNQLFTGDFNGDGRTDLLVAQRFAGGFAILYQDEEGRFGAKIDRRKAKNDYGLELVDVNGDGRADVVTAGGEIFLRAPDGSLPVEPDLKLKGSAGSWVWLATGDFNGDGRTDLVFLDSEQPHLRVMVYYNTGDAKTPFHPEPDSVLELPWKGHMRDGPVAGDVDGDGIADLLVCPNEAVGTSANEVAELHVLRGSRPGGLSLANSFRVKLDYAIHYDTRLGLVDLEGKGRVSIAGFGPSKSAQATGVYIRHFLPAEK